MSLFVQSQIGTGGRLSGKAQHFSSTNCKAGVSSDWDRDRGFSSWGRAEVRNLVEIVQYLISWGLIWFSDVFSRLLYFLFVSLCSMILKVDENRNACFFLVIFGITVK